MQIYYIYVSKQFLKVSFITCIAVLPRP